MKQYPLKRTTVTGTLTEVKIFRCGLIVHPKNDNNSEKVFLALSLVEL